MDNLKVEITKKDAYHLNSILEYVLLADKGESMASGAIWDLAGKGLSSTEINYYFNFLSEFKPAVFKKNGAAVWKGKDCLKYIGTDYTPTFIKNGGFVEIYKHARRRRLISEIPRWLPILISFGALIISFLSFFYKYHNNQ